MGEPAPLEPESDPTPPVAGAATPARADWLVGAEEGIDAELKRKDDEGGAHRAPAPKLFRPGGDAPAEPPARTPAAAKPPAPLAAQRVGLALPARPAEPAAIDPILPASDETEGGFTHGHSMVWQPAPSSIPAVRRDAPRRTLPAAEPTRDFPMDDADERRRANVEAAALAATAAEGAARPHSVVSPEAFDLAATPLPWWLQLPLQFKTDRRLQLLAGAVVVLLLTVAFWPRGEQPVSLGSLNRHPDRFDGHAVKVSGRVGDVFDVGGGHAYYLLQGRDTLVVFTRSTAPHLRDHVTVSGTISTGYLGGEPHMALFAEGAAP